MFPTTDEAGTATNTSGNEYSKTGRTPGFNWTEAATIPEDKNKEYAVNPVTLIGKIQKNHNELFNESNEGKYLDYEFYLTPSDLKAINNAYGGKSYTDFQGESRYDEKSKIYIYQSRLFRNGGILSKAAKKLALLGCNNQASANVCDYSNTSERSN